MKLRRPALRLALPCCAVAFAALAACGAGGAERAIIAADTIALADTGWVVDVDAGSPDTAAPVADDAEAPVDSQRAASAAAKDDPDYLVPADVAARTAVAVSGARVAWFERGRGGQAPLLVWWDAAEPTSPPRPILVPNLVAPRDLVFGDAHLVYVDERYGDADLFAVALDDGAERALVTRPGEQQAPTIRGTVVAWEDCRGCVSGDDGAGREIYERDLAGGAEVRVTDDDVPDRGPAFGTLAGGEGALAWIAEDRRLRVRGAGVDVALPAGQDVGAIALTGGVLAWRPRPLILNPDSMMPSDLMLTDVLSGATTAATFHAELRPGVQPAPAAAAGLVAWLESAAGAPATTRLRVIEADGLAPILSVAEQGIEAFAMSGTHVAFLAPRADNGGLVDVWIRGLP